MTDEFATTEEMHSEMQSVIKLEIASKTSYEMKKMKLIKAERDEARKQEA